MDTAMNSRWTMKHKLGLKDYLLMVILFTLLTIAWVIYSIKGWLGKNDEDM